MTDIPRVADERLIEQVRAEFLEMPGLRLTARQAQRLWGCDAETCLRALEQLVESRFLSRAPTDPWLFLDRYCYQRNVDAMAVAA